MRFSVVINTYNRAESLAATLRGLRHQSHGDFEVIVVNGPSTDDTQALLASWQPDVRVASCPERHLGKSRNLGIDAAAGDVVAFIDDDAVPESSWLADLDAGYDNDRVAGVGGVVFDHTGMRFQYEISICDRVGEAQFDVKPPLTLYQRPGADPFVYLQGTNASFRRRCLEEIDGFDEEIEYYHDETDVCLQLTDRGYILRPLATAAVHHHYLPSDLRASRHVWLNPYPPVKNRFYFASRYGTATRSEGAILRTLFDWLDGVIHAAEQLFASGEMTADQLQFFRQQVDRGIGDGIARAHRGARSGRAIVPQRSSSFVKLRTPQPAVPRLRLCFVSEEFPPGPVGGIGRFTADLAGGLAAAGHEVHVVTRSSDVNRVDVEDDVWVHRVAVQNRNIPGLTAAPLAGNLLHHAALYHEVRRLHDRLPLSLVSAPIWNAAPFLYLLDPCLTTVTWLQTTVQTVADLMQSWSGSDFVDSLKALELITAEESTDFHAGSEATLSSLDDQFPGVQGRRHLLPHGTRDRADVAPPMAKDPSRLRVLFVGRLERRKGVDVLLEIAPELLRRHTDAEIVLVGKDTLNTEIEGTYRESFERQHKDDPELLERVRFTGEAPDEDRERWYASADIFCAPSRYESFGLVLTEAMSHGLPLVSCDVGGIPEIFDGNGLLAPPGDPAALLKCLDQLVSDPEARATMGKRSRELFEGKWNLTRWVERVEASYAEIAQRARSHGRSSGAGISRHRLAKVLTKIGAVRQPAALDVATALLDSSAYPVDEASKVLDLLQVDDATFVAGVFDLLLGRDVEGTGLENALASLQHGTTRMQFIESVLSSDEAAQRRLDTSWLPKVVPLWSAMRREECARLLDEPVDRFVQGLYRVLLSRDPDPDGIAGWTALLANGTSRAEAVRLMALSEEAQRKGLPVDWLGDIAGQPAQTKPALAPLRTDLRQPFARRAARLARRLTAALDARVTARSQVADVLAAVQSLRASLDALHRVVAEDRQMVSELKLTVAAVGAATSDVDTRLNALGSPLVKSQDELALIHERLAVTHDQLLRTHESSASLVANWLEILGQKQEAVAMELRDRLPPRPNITELPEPVILNPDSMPGGPLHHGPLRLNLGCGEKILAGYINIDLRPLPGVDVAADVRRLPFDPETVDEVASFHLVEHFRRHQFEVAVLPYWCSLLRPGGLLRIVCPNWRAMIDQVSDGRLSLSDFGKGTFGAQEYEGDDHFSMYSPDMLCAILRTAGLVEVAPVTEARWNGLTVEMEVVGRRSLTAAST